MPKHARSAVLLTVVSALAGTLGREAWGASCSPSTGQSTCFDADTLAQPFAPSDFFMLPRARAMQVHSWALGFDLTVLHHPVVLHAPSPDPNGRDLDVVGDLFDATLALAVSPVRHLELGAALPLSLYRAGTGLSAVTSQTGPDLSRTVLRDVRIGAGYDVFHSVVDGGRTETSGLVRLDLTLPTGQNASFAGQRAPMAEPALDVDVRSDRFFASVEERVRLREPVTFGGDVLGTQFLSSLGVGYDALDRGLLRVTLEAYVAPYLSTRTVILPDGTRVVPGTLVPAEWMLSVRTRRNSVELGLGGGTGIPFSSEARVAPSGIQTKDTFAPVTTPEFRFAFTFRYLLPGSEKR